MASCRRDAETKTGAKNPTPQGPLAQLVERFHGMEEVNGSIPLGSTNKNSAQMAEFLLYKRNLFFRRWSVVLLVVK